MSPFQSSLDRRLTNADLTYADLAGASLSNAPGDTGGTMRVSYR
ncbi:MAG: pentapeptide repeat-containing protein [Gammaproteobacteria bacterium]|nr:pentapeptide repeat-containing protein [Gammaproteobacteria bacterium]